MEGKKLTPAEVFEVIKSERIYQDRDLKDKEDHRGKPSVEAELLLAEEYLLKARAAWQSNSGNTECLDVMRKVAGVLVRCFENHGCPKRDIVTGQSVPSK